MRLGKQRVVIVTLDRRERESLERQVRAAGLEPVVFHDSLDLRRDTPERIRFVVVSAALAELVGRLPAHLPTAPDGSQPLILLLPPAGGAPLFPATRGGEGGDGAGESGAAAWSEPERRETAPGASGAPRQRRQTLPPGASRDLLLSGAAREAMLQQQEIIHGLRRSLARLARTQLELQHRLGLPDNEGTAALRDIAINGTGDTGALRVDGARQDRATTGERDGVAAGDAAGGAASHAGRAPSTTPHAAFPAVDATGAEHGDGPPPDTGVRRVAPDGSSASIAGAPAAPAAAPPRRLTASTDAVAIGPWRPDEVPVIPGLVDDEGDALRRDRGAGVQSTPGAAPASSATGGPSPLVWVAAALFLVIAVTLLVIDGRRQPGPAAPAASAGQDGEGLAIVAARERAAGSASHAREVAGELDERRAGARARCFEAVGEGAFEAGLVACTLAAPGDAEVNRLLGESLFQLERSEEALRALGVAVELEPDEPEGWLMLGDARSALGDVDGARLAWSRYLELSPDGEYAERLREMMGQ